MKKGYVILISVVSIMIVSALIFVVLSVRNFILVKELAKAVENNDITAAEEIIEKGVDLNRSIKSALDRFVSESYSSTPLKEACGDGSLEMVKLLVENGADVNYTKQNVTPFSPLMCAMRNETKDQLEIVKYLLEKGADPNYSLGGRNDVFQSLIEHNRDISDKVEILKLLEKYGGDLQRINISGDSLLNTACYWQENEVIKYLLEKDDTNVNNTDKRGYTPLMEYCDLTPYFDINTLDTLIAHGADITLKNEDGKTALDCAIESGNTEAIELLQNK